LACGNFFIIFYQLIKGHIKEVIFCKINFKIEKEIKYFYCKIQTIC